MGKRLSPFSPGRFRAIRFTTREFAQLEKLATTTKRPATKMEFIRPVKNA
jgi:hypothetical protein